MVFQMSPDNVAVPEPPELSPRRLADRRAHLLEEITSGRSLDGWRRVRNAFPGDRGNRWLLAAAILALVGGAGTAVAVGVNLVRQEESFYEKWIARDPHSPNLQGSFVEVVGSSDWALIAWRSDQGICLDLATPGHSASSCGFPVVGAPPDRTQPGADEPKHMVAYLAGRAEPGDLWDLAGVAAETVARVEIEMADGRTLAAPMYDAPAELGTRLRFFIQRIEVDESSLVPPGEPPHLANVVNAFVAYHADGTLVERLPVAPGER
jgi:hypothetical protein